ncbi:RRP15-like protein [Agrilus planipennis]|uniref:RRP15-like protein n=1 Tax=Agrilus planipennis TaxID=224129 RepID=A0A1W4XQF6_AGRPL|nr:RRP15-like protein [Agrilus planipennis]
MQNMTAVKKVVLEKDNSSDLSESEIERSSENEFEENEVNDKANAGWADSISKILKANKPKGKKTLVLSKAKKLTDLPKKQVKDVGFEVEKDGQITQEVDSECSDSNTVSDEEKFPSRKRKRDIPSIRVKPNILQKDRERKLQKIATKGVVQLFNAVKSQQKEIDTKLKEAGSLEVKRDKVLKSIDKRTFLDVLMGKKSESVDQNPDTDIKKDRVKENNTWSVLKDDFMMGAKMKDWDKEQEMEQESENEMELESD